MWISRYLVKFSRLMINVNKVMDKARLFASFNQHLFVPGYHVEYRHLVALVSFDQAVLWKEQFVTMEK